jgi:hypothetical protein
MANFKRLKDDEVWRIVLETHGPRSLEDQEDFRKALLQLIAMHQTTVLGYKRGPTRKKTPRRATGRRRGKR